MKNWLVALFGVSLVAITYTAYELELKTPSNQPMLQKAVATGQPVTTIPPQKSKKPAQVPSNAVPPSQADAADKLTAESAKLNTARPAGSNPAPAGSDDNADVAKIGATRAPATIAPQAEKAEQPTAAEPAASARSEPASPKTQPPSEMRETATAGQKSQVPQFQVVEPPAAQPQPAPSAVLAPVARAVDNVRKMLSGGADSPSVAKVETPQPPAVQAPPAKAEEAAPKGLVERAVKAVTDLVTPKPALDRAQENQKAAVENSGSGPDLPAASPPGGETRVAGRAPESRATPVTPVKPVKRSVVPSFDVVRVERDGSAVIAGRAEPGAQIELRAGGKTLGSARASSRGEFVIIPGSPIPSGSSALALEARSGDGKVTKSDQVVTVAVPEPKTAPSTTIAAAPAAVPAPLKEAPAAKAPAPAATTPEQNTAAAPTSNRPLKAAPSSAKPRTEPTAEAESDPPEIMVAQAAEPPKAGVTPLAQLTVRSQPEAEMKITDTPSAAAGSPVAILKTQPQAASPATVAEPGDTEEAATGKGDGLENTKSAVIVSQPPVSPAVTDESRKTAAAKPAENTAEVIVVPAKPGSPASAPESTVAAVAVVPDVKSSEAGGAVAAANRPGAADPGTEGPVAVVTPKADAKTPAASPEPQIPLASPAPQAPEPQIPQTSSPSLSSSVSEPAAAGEAAAPARSDIAPPAQIADSQAPAKLSEPLVVVSEPGSPSRVLQGGNGKPKTPITFDTVDYDDKGQIILAGQVAPGADVRAYLGAAHLGDARADPGGRWVLRTTRQIDPGNYQLRVDKIDFGGKVLARVTAPFERASPEAVARVRADGEVIIQPGDNLWNISRSLYGSGTQYTVIYDANRNQISRPDLIFPGQVFMTPGAGAEKVAGATGG